MSISNYKLFCTPLELHKRRYFKTIDIIDFSSFYMNYINIIRSQTRLCNEIFKKVGEGVKNGAPADQLLAKILRSRREIGSRDRKLINDLVFSYYRWKGWLKFFEKLDQEALFALALLLDNKNDYKICNYWGENLADILPNINSIDFKKGLDEKAKIFFNLNDNTIRSFIKELFPNWLTEKVLSTVEEEFRDKFLFDFASIVQTRSPLWIRSSLKNPAKLSSILEKANVNFIRHPVIKSAWSITASVNLNMITGAKSVPFETQDLSSQAVGLVCNPKPKETWLDACAGSGGKTLHLAYLSKGKANIIAYDVRKNMLKKVLSRSKKWRLKNISIFENQRKIFRNFSNGFDGVLVDAPCSGIGTWRRNPDARWRLTESDISEYSKKQYDLLVNMSLLVRPGGVLIFSVCTLTGEETYGCIKRFLKDFEAFKLMTFSNPINGEKTDGTLEIWPQNYDCDGMFIAKMQRSK